MSHPRNDEPIGISKPDLIAAWAILENLTVSLDQIGGFFGEHAPPAALNKSLGDYFTPALVEAIGHARARLARYIAEGEAEVARAGLLEFLLDALRRDRLHQRHRVLGVEDLGLQLAHGAVQAQRGRFADRQVKVGRLLLHYGFQQSIDLNRCHGPIR